MGKTAAVGYVSYSLDGALSVGLASRLVCMRAINAERVIKLCGLVCKPCYHLDLVVHLH